MKHQLQQFEADYLANLVAEKKIPEFQAGDTVKVNYKIPEGDKWRIQAYQGICIARRRRGLNSSFTVRKISNGEGVERIFPLYSPKIESIEVLKKGVVRRAKLYYLRKLTGKASRISEKMDFGGDDKINDDKKTAE